MKLRKNIYTVAILSALILGAQSCFQDLDNDPAFNYPEEPIIVKPPVDETGLLFHMSFDENYTDAKSEIAASVVGTPTLVEGKEGKAYAGAPDSYLKFNTSDLVEELGEEFTVAFWYKISPESDRAGIITMGPETAGAEANAQNNRNSGLRIFREGNATRQVVKGNIGTGTADVWLDGGDASALDPTTAGWTHIAVTISQTKAALYFDGVEVSTVADFKGVNWDGCDILSIGSGAPRFTEWNHLSDPSLIDELQFYNKALTADEIKNVANLRPALDISDQVFYAPFNGSYNDLEGGATSTKVGTPTFAVGKAGRAYSGAADSYLSFNTADLKEAFGTEYSVSFWYKVNADPDRAGILVISADDPEKAADAKINLTKGIRIFREASGEKQIIKANVGVGADNVWLDGGATATIDPAAGEWVHIVLTLAADKAILYLNGTAVKESAITGVDWADCETISVGSGVPYFVGWNHKSDLSLIDELRMYNKTLTVEEIATIIAYDNN